MQANKQTKEKAKKTNIFFNWQHMRPETCENLGLNPCMQECDEKK
jgi:hypothetical protein